MTRKQRDIYSAYVYNQRCRMEEDIRQLQQNLRWRNISYIDCLELVIAQTRFDAFCEFVNDMNGIFDIEKYDLKVNLQKKP